ncbi:MAG: DUF4034 domain-containing protein [Planctomycetes bacterium]|nr:DUF4034 domain-containing protein [Planctomycetota bacterium]
MRAYTLGTSGRAAPPLLKLVVGLLALAGAAGGVWWFLSRPEKTTEGEGATAGHEAADALPGRVRTLFAEERFAELDQLADKLFAEKTRNDEGDWELEGFYDALDEPPDPAAAGAWERMFERFERWEKRLPGSPTALAAHGEALTGHAWAARGNDWASNVHDEQWRGFRERLVAAKALLERAEALPKRVPGVYTALQTVALGQGWPREKYEELFRKAVALEPAYTEFYRRKATYLLPRWHGAPGDWERFAAEAAAATKRTLGLALYAQIVLSVKDFADEDELLTGSHVDWPRLRQGLLDLRDRFENKSWFEDNCAWFACHMGDRFTARTRFEKLGESWHTTLWESAEDRQKWVQWASLPETDEEVERRLRWTRIGVQLQDKSLADLLRWLREQGEVGFAIDDAMLRRAEPIDPSLVKVTVREEDASLQKLLKDTLPGLGLVHRVAWGTVLVTTPDRLRALEAATRPPSSGAQATPEGARTVARLAEHCLTADYNHAPADLVRERLASKSEVPLRFGDASFKKSNVWLFTEHRPLPEVFRIFAFILDAELSFEGAGVLLKPRPAAGAGDK